jgi:iron(III) transport system ATP-binding protein
VAIGRALLAGPRLLLLDEPLSALDALERVRLRQEIRSLQQQLGVTTIMVTHDQEEALSMADRIVVMNHGVIDQVGTPLEVYRDPASPFVADFVGKVNVLPGRVQQGRLLLGSLSLPAQGPDREVRVYLRPEDVQARTERSSQDHAFAGTIEQVDFLGAFCHVHVRAPSLGAQALAVAFPLSYLSEQSLVVGSSIQLSLMPERVKLF